MKVFYSWQSDLENQYNRSFIKNVLDKSIQELNLDLAINEAERIELDHDTKNSPGTPNLAETIFEKISNSSVFIADISFVAERKSTDGTVVRKVANPNVLIELGYALSVLGSDRVICILNTSTGSVDKLPFDLKHKRYPIQYELTHNRDKKKQKQDLIKDIKVAIKNIVESEKYRKKDIILTPNPTKEEIINVIMSSDSKDDWSDCVYNTSASHAATIYFNQNVNIRLIQYHSEEAVQCMDFQEYWANKHPDSHATGYWYDLYFCATHIDRFVLVSVDGGRAHLPLPKSMTDLIVSPLNYKIAKIFDQSGRLDEYMSRSNLKLENSDIA